MLVAACCSVLQRVASVLQFAAGCYPMLSSSWPFHLCVSCDAQYLLVAACCNVLQRVAVRCSALQCVAGCYPVLSGALPIQLCVKFESMICVHTLQRMLQRTLQHTLQLTTLASCSCDICESMTCTYYV